MLKVLQRRTGYILLTTMSAMFFLFSPNSASAATAPGLGSAATYAVLGGLSVTNTGATVINGDLGVSPGSSVTGFPPGTINGATHAGDTTALNVQNDATTAYANILNQNCTNTLSSAELGGKTLIPGVHCFTGDTTLTGTLALDAQNDANAVFIIRIIGKLTTANNAFVSLTNGAIAANIFWQTVDSATLGMNTVFQGNLFSLNNISLGTNVNVTGRVLSRVGSVTLDTDTINLPPASTKGTLIVTKTVVNNNGGTKTASDFTINVTGTNASPSSFAGSTSGTIVMLDPGAYSVDEAVTNGYAKSLSATCTGNILAGETRSCTVTNDDIGPVPPSGKATLVVRKAVINDNGGNKVASDFSISVTGTNASPNSFNGSASGTTVTLDPGTYTVTESAISGYNTAYGANCTGSLTAGEIRGCTVTNNDISQTPPPPNTCAGFVDVSANDPHCPEITYVSNLGIMTGNSDGTFAPNASVQRDQMSKISLMAFNKFDSSTNYCNGVQPFPDVSSSEWSFQYVCRGKQIGMITGYLGAPDKGFYRPSRPVNRAELLALVLRNVNETMPSIFSSSYWDVASGLWFSGYASYSMSHDLFSGSYLYPGAYAPRWEVAMVLYKLHNQGKF